MSDTKTISVPSEIVRWCFSIRPDDGWQRFGRPALMSALLSWAELPWSMPWTNIKVNMITGNLTMVGTAKAIYQKGWTHFFAGTTDEFLRQGARQVFRGPCVSLLPAYIKKNISQELHWTVPFASGIVTAIAEVTGTAYFESRKTRNNSIVLAENVTNKFSAFSGYFATLARQIPAWMILFNVKDMLQHNLPKDDKGRISFFHLVLASPILAASFIAPCHPFDMIKTHKQSASKSKYGITRATPLTTALKLIYNHGGLPELFRGVTSSVIQRTTAALIIFYQSEWYRVDNKPSIPISEIVVAAKEQYFK